MTSSLCRFASSLICRWSLAVAVVSMVVAHAPAHAVIIDWVTVGDPGNVADTTGTPNPAGAVLDSFQIMKYEWTNSQYVEFLNAVDPNGTNPNSIYTDSMGSDARGGISFTSGNTAGSKYAARTNMGDKPVNFVSWWDAARVANWLHNGQGSGSTETGAYTLNNATFGETPAVNAGANFYIPTQDQWYKAACYKGGSTNAGYWDYATQSDTAPTAVSATVVGTGSSGGVSPVITGNFANYKRGVTWNGRTANVTNRGLRGGRLDGIALYLQSSSAAKMGTTNETNNAGFRLASPVAVPEPSTWVMGLAGIACGGWGMLRRRKRA